MQKLNNDSTYSFLVSDKLKQDETFIKYWNSNIFENQKRYKKLAKMFNNNKFCLYRKELLSDEFFEKFKYGMRCRWHEKNKEAFDPATQPAFSEIMLSQEELENLQDILVVIMQKYGELGLNKIREFNLAQGVMKYKYPILITDSEDIYDLETDNHNQKILTINRNRLNPLVKLTALLENKVFKYINNENIKSALFFMSDCLFEDGHLISDCEIYEYVLELSKLQPLLTISLNYQDFYRAVNEFSYSYITKHNEKIPKKYIKTTNHG